MRRYLHSVVAFAALAYAAPASASCLKGEVVSIAPAMATVDSNWRAGAVTKTQLEIQGCETFTVTTQVVSIDSTKHGERARMFIIAEQGGQVTRIAVQLARGVNEIAPFLTTINDKLTWVFSEPDRQALKPSVKSDV